MATTQLFIKDAPSIRLKPQYKESNFRKDTIYGSKKKSGNRNTNTQLSSVARNRNWCRDQDRENCTSELPVADLQHHPKTTPTEEEATVRRLYVRPPVEHLRII
nr:unnamed protein product [Callosobruchus analis]